MKPIILQLGGIGSSSAASSSSSPSSSSSSPSSISSPSSAASSAAGLQVQERAPRDVAVDLSVLGNKKCDGRPNMMTTVVTNNAMSEPQPPQHAPQQRTSSSHSGSSMSKSITRLLQHSILQLCNEHIGYTHKLQILGVLCMTVDDEQQELVVKVNNTLKRVGPVTGPKDAVHLAAAGMPPSVQTLTSPPSSHPHHVAAMSHHHPHSHHHQHHPHHAQPHHQGTDLSLHARMTSRDEPRSHPSSPSPSPVPLNMSGRKSHGRKGSNPTKVQQVVEENPLDTDDDDDDEEEPLTIMPEAPEATMGRLESGPASPAPQPAASSTPTSSGKYRGPGSGPSGSAKRKPSHQFRVPQYPSPAGSPYIRSLPESTGSPYTLEEGTDPSGASSTGRGALTGSSSSSSSSSSGHGISLPIYVAGTYSAHDQDGQDDQPINLAAGSSASTSPSLSRPPHNGMLVMNGRDSREGSPACSSANGERPGSTSSLHQGRVKDEPDEDSENEYKEHLTSLEEYARANVAALFSPAEVADRDARMEGLHAALPYSGIGMYLPRQRFDSPSPSRLEPGTDRDGLSIKYTSTGPYTVGANGKDVSNSSRIKDIIMYDDQSPLSAQKGARIETDYIVDKLGMDGRKRRRRAPEDLLTPEEIAEYLGQPERSDFNFRCKYCSEEFDSITRYIHHTLAAHQAYICHQCGKSFTTKSSLLRHRPIHTGMRRFACSICKKTFYRKDKCKAHIRRHLGLPSGAAVPADADNNVLETSAPLVADHNSSSSQFPSPVEAVDVDSP